MPPKKIFFIHTIGNLAPVIDSKSFLEDGKVTMTQEQKPFFFMVSLQFLHWHSVENSLDISPSS